ncbi:MAG: sugar nucleotide-binding protein [Gemmatimonadetes bacterium]|mgnify:FL=1|jgi:dTDP-4-dehydrorhamnose reductase|nr:sugar nucleotide-binding protein [Gemmatimonadota bacterium]MBT6144620.1 sugar nucleotide-binding protein [Gemmatimonadota bacterium]MBT7863700.1 sugar nucleotide-binding protein [Gemmatimonadota bacterium]
MAGFALAQRYPESLRPFVPPNRPGAWPALNLEDPAWLAALVQELEPRLLIYCHAVCNVRKCEESPDWAYDINVNHIRRLHDALPDTTRLVYVSSDHVFGDDGTYSEVSNTCPISVYGRTRVEAEALVLARPGSLVIRSGLAIGPSYDGRSGHLDWLTYRHERNLPLTIVEDESRSTVMTHDLADRIMHLATSNETGLRHISAALVSRMELARFLTRQLGIDPVLNTVLRHQQPAPHMGRVELTTIHEGPLHQPLPGVLTSDLGDWNSDSLP